MILILWSNVPSSTDTPTPFIFDSPSACTFADLAKSSGEFAFGKEGWFLLVSLVLHVVI